MKKKELVITIQSSEIDFGKLAKIEKNPSKRIRLLGLQMLKDGKTFSSIAEALGVLYTTVKDWGLRFIESGVNGLQDLPGRGRKPLFPVHERNELAVEIEKMQQEKEGGRITGKDIQAHLENKWGVTYGLGGTYNLLDKCKIVWITGRSKHPKSNLEEQEEFKKNSKILLNQQSQKIFRSKT